MTKSQKQTPEQRKANIRIAIILAVIALAASAYPFFFFPKIFGGG